MTIMNTREILDEARYRIKEATNCFLACGEDIRDLARDQLEQAIREGRYRMRSHPPENRQEYSSWEKLRDVIEEASPLRVRVQSRDELN